MNKALTLTELIVAITLMGVIILGVVSFDFGSRNMLKSSERKTQVMNQAALILDRISKDALTGIGDLGAPAMNVTANALNIRQDDGDGVRESTASDPIVSYVFDNGAHTLTRTVGASPAETMSDNVVDFTAIIFDNTALVTIQLRPNPAIPENAFDNPQVTIQSSIEAPAWSLN
ncbi:MAG: type II secretion system protein [Candidatus Omnitrophota bacterium]|jgi:type II secretory pathway pseudopilin PulG